jgi:molybdopterin molybdotransferase
MTPLDEALNLILETGKSLSPEKIPLALAYNRVLAEDVYSDIDIPSFNKSAMDGFAIRSQDIHNEWEVIEFIPAGSKAEKEVKKNQCSRVMTGGMVPQGADMVVMVEHTEELPNGKFRSVKGKSKSNILHRGEDVKKGEMVLEKGTLLQPPHIGILAGAGKSEVEVYSLPKMAISSTGTELVEPNVIPEPPFIRNTNSYHLQALCAKEGIQAENAGILEDDPGVITTKIKELLEENDIVIFTGGASFGDHDFSKTVMENLGADIKFTKLAIQPGKPALFATVGDKYLFGLSGNPVSSSVQFILLVRPFIHFLCGQKEEGKVFNLPMAHSHSRKKAERALFFPVKITSNSKAVPVDYHGSAHLNAFETADALACFPIGKFELKEGEIVDVRPL